METLVYFKSPFQVYNSVVSSKFTVLCNHHHYLFPKIFHHPKRKRLYPWSNNFLILLLRLLVTSVVCHHLGDWFSIFRSVPGAPWSDCFLAWTLPDAHCEFTPWLFSDTQLSKCAQYQAVAGTPMDLVLNTLFIKLLHSHPKLKRNMFM